MKRLLFAAFMLTTFAACNSNKKAGDVTITGKDGEQVTVNTNEMVNAANEMKNRNEELQKLTPLSMDELKAFLPGEIMGAKRSNMEATKMAGLASFSKAEYQMNDSTKIELSVFDCAGTAGAGYYNMAFFGLMNFEQDNEREYTKTTAFKGDKAIEHCQKERNDCEFTFFGGDRFLIQLKGDNVGIDKLKQVAEGLNIK
jgi:hypothetical protein